MFFFSISLALLVAGYFAALNLLRLMTDYLSAVFKITVISLAPHDIILTIFKIDFLIYLIIILPFLLTAAVLYLRPALYEKERRLLHYIPAVFILGSLGIAFGWIISIKVFIPYLQSFAGVVNIPNNWSIINVVSFILSICIVFMFIFQMPIVISALVNLEFLKLKQIKTIRKAVIFLSVLFGAIVTPPDVASQLIVALPFYLLFELTIVYIKIKHWFTGKKFN